MRYSETKHAGPTPGREGEAPSSFCAFASLDEINERIREAIEVCLKVEGAPDQNLEFVGIQRVTIAA